MSSIKEYAYRVMAEGDICSDMYSGWHTIDRLAKSWREEGICTEFVDYATAKLITERAAEYQALYDSIQWAKGHIPRYMLNDWCREHGYDFMTLCRFSMTARCNGGILVMFEALDALSDEALHRRYVLERLKGCHKEFPGLLNELARAWRECGSNDALSEYVCKYGSPITGMPDLEHFVHNEMFNTRIVEAQVELIPSRWAEMIGMDMYDAGNIHRDRVHKPVGESELCYKPGRF